HPHNSSFLFYNQYHHTQQHRIQCSPESKASSRLYHIQMRAAYIATALAAAFAAVTLAAPAADPGPLMLGNKDDGTKPSATLKQTIQVKLDPTTIGDVQYNYKKPASSDATVVKPDGDSGNFKAEKAGSADLTADLDCGGDGTPKCPDPASPWKVTVTVTAPM
ncbi:hypothetical protein GQ42DRAFT_169617, partial [Ramicandelaber brevisporus]